MPLCSICGEAIPEGSRTCAVCGTSADDFLPTGNLSSLPASEAVTATEIPPGTRYCPVCVRVYEPLECLDGFCSCGTELVQDAAPTLAADVPMAPFMDEVPMAPFMDEVPMAPVLEETDFSHLGGTMVPVPTQEAEEADVKVRIGKPGPGTPCLVLYGPDKLPLRYFALTKDTMMIGRLDAVAGHFPDIDLDEWFDRATIRKISRQHALILRSRAMRSFSLRPLVGNTGTQLDADMVAPQQDYPLKPGARIILGGVIRMKFEIA